MQRYVDERGVRRVTVTPEFAAILQRGSITDALNLEAQHRGYRDWAQYEQEWPKMAATVRGQIERGAWYL
jgi:hypothetical protein